MRLARVLCTGLVAGALLLGAGSAEARRGIAIINTGNDIFEAGPLPAPFDKEPQLAGAQAGFKCSIFGVFWIYLHWWDCQPVGFRGDTYYDNPELVKAVAATYKQGDMKPGFWKGMMRWVLLAGALGMGAIAWFSRKSGDDDTEEGSGDAAKSDQA